MTRGECQAQVFGEKSYKLWFGGLFYHRRGGVPPPAIPKKCLISLEFTDLREAKRLPYEGIRWYPNVGAGFPVPQGEMFVKSIFPETFPGGRGNPAPTILLLLTHWARLLGAVRFILQNPGFVL